MEANASDAPAVTPEEKPASVTTEKKKKQSQLKTPVGLRLEKKLAEHNRRVRAAKNKLLLLLHQHQKQRPHLLIHPLRWNKTKAKTLATSSLALVV